MMCYRDRTWCGYWATCAHGETCSRALRPEIVDAANMAGLPLAQWAEEPTCYDDNQEVES